MVILDLSLFLSSIYLSHSLFYLSLFLSLSLSFLSIYLSFYRPFHPFIYLSTETKNQWARDDPAFVVIMVAFLAIGSLSFAVAFHAESLVNMIRITFSTIFVDFLTLGCLVATLCW